MLFAHADQTVVRSDHQETVVGLAGQQPEDCRPQVPLVACKVSEADDFGRPPSNLFPSKFSTRDVGHNNFSLAVETHYLHAD